MHIEEVEISSLIEYQFNNKRHEDQQVDRIANSIQQFGMNQPIVVDEENVILVGHGRLRALKKLGRTKAPVLKKTGLTEVQKKAYRVLDNALQDQAPWDYNNLELELGFLEDNGVDLGEWGLDELLAFVDNENQAVEDDEFVACENEETFIKRGDLIELGRHRLLCGDSTNKSDVEYLLNGIKPELMFTDPPYGVSYTGGHFHSGDVNIKREREALVSDDDDAIYEQFLPVWAPLINGPCYVFHAGSCPFALYKAIEQTSCQIHALIIWHKINATYAAMNAQYKQRHEPCLYFKPPNTTTRWIGPSDECTVWEEKRDPSNNFHPTQKPIVVVARALRNHSSNTVADPFLGSGATLIACEQLNRTCYGMEISPKYCEVIIDRYRNHCEKNNKPFDCKVNGEPLP